MSRHPVKWLAPAPVWPELAKSGVPAFVKPDILRFTSDSFMDDFLRQLETDPAGTVALRAQAETWRGPAAALKLYQAAHQRHYLVTASLVCQIAGLPDRTVDTGQQESVSFVLRRLLPNGNGERDEYAMVTSDEGYTWTRVIAGNRLSPDTLVPGEELLPMFPVNYRQHDRRRRLFAGTIPVGKQEIYENSVLDETSNIGQNGSATTAKTARKIHFQTEIMAPWRNLIDSALTLASMSSDAQFSEPDSPFAPPSLADRTRIRREQLKSGREQMQTGSWYILLDFANYLDRYMPAMRAAIEANNKSGLTRQAERDFYDLLVNTTLPVALITELSNDDPNTSIKNIKLNLQAAMRAMLRPQLDPGETRSRRTLEADLEALDVAYESKTPDAKWPKFLFPLADPRYGGLLPNIPVGVPSNDPRFVDEKFNAFLARLVAALPEESTEAVPAIPLAARLANQGKLEDGDSVYHIRCVFRRPQCHPVHTDVVSEPTVRFQLAGFFDPDAPARPIRITLPADPTPAGLRKYAKNTAFMMSDALCGQMSAIKKITFGDLVRSVLPWPFHKDLPISAGDMKPCKDGSNNPIGRVCSLSIPIVTICAMFLLIMIVLILDFVFKWVPFLISCFPLPKFKAKK